MQTAKFVTNQRFAEADWLELMKKANVILNESYLLFKKFLQLKSLLRLKFF